MKRQALGSRRVAEGIKQEFQHNLLYASRNASLTLLFFSQLSIIDQSKQNISHNNQQSKKRNQTISNQQHRIISEDGTWSSSPQAEFYQLPLGKTLKRTQKVAHHIAIRKTNHQSTGSGKNPAMGACFWVLDAHLLLENATSKVRKKDFVISPSMFQVSHFSACMCGTSELLTIHAKKS